MDTPYANREIDEKFVDIQRSLDRIEVQTTKHNGRMTRMERVMLVVATAVGVLLLTNGSKLLEFLSAIIV